MLAIVKYQLLPRLHLLFPSILYRLQDANEARKVNRNSYSRVKEPAYKKICIKKQVEEPVYQKILEIFKKT